MPGNSNINSEKLKKDLKHWVCNNPIINGVVSNPIIISILIITVIWLVDIAYGKTFECASSKEMIQHASTVFMIMIAGIFLNNLAIKKCINDDDRPVQGGRDHYAVEPREVSQWATNNEPSHTTSHEPANIDSMLAMYEPPSSAE